MTSSIGGRQRRPTPPRGRLRLRRRLILTPLVSVLNAALVLSVGASFTAGCATYVRFENATPEKHPLLLFDGWRDGACRNDEVFRLVEPGVVRLGRLKPLEPACPAEFIAVAEGAGAVAHLWKVLPAQDARVDGRLLSVQFGELRRLPVTLWVWGTAPPATEDWVSRQVREANDLYAILRVGAILDTVRRLIPASSSIRVALASRCDGIRELAANGLADSGRINAYFFILPEVDTSLAGSGDDCSVQGHWDLVFVFNDYYHLTLAHELGHAMGLLEPPWGDVYGLPGFESNPQCPDCDLNLMVGQIEAVKDVTLGQLFRMNLDAKSWWNFFAEPDPFAEMTRACQPGDAALNLSKPCPRLALREGGPP